MEFLVRLDDKINTQVFCLNPVHKGLHMDRVFFEDETFEAVCPECSSSEYLYRKNNAISKKGHFIVYESDGFNWEGNEAKHYGIVRIDCTGAQAKEWCETIEDEQAKADIKDYESDYEERLKILVESEASKLAIENDIQLIAIDENLILAENRVQIAYRHRKQAFDFDKALTVEQLKNWDDQRAYSKVIAVSDTTQIKEATYAVDNG